MNKVGRKCAQLSVASIVYLTLALHLEAQHAFERDGRVIYESAQDQQVDLGVGFNPIMTADRKVALVRGRRFAYGEAFDCHNPTSKNWIVLYDPAAKSEKKIFDRQLEFDGKGSLGFCIFEQMQLSSDASTLYLVSPVSATSGSLAIVNRMQGKTTYVPGVMSVYVIKTGPHRDELIYVRRVWHKSPQDDTGYTSYPFIHALANGQQVAEISNEFFTVGANDEVPILRAYLRKLGGTINVSGRIIP